MAGDPLHGWPRSLALIPSIPPWIKEGFGKLMRAVYLVQEPGLEIDEEALGLLGQLARTAISCKSDRGLLPPLIPVGAGTRPPVPRSSGRVD